MENNRGSFASNMGFLMAAIGSAVGLGNIWGFPYKMGRCGGFTFLIVYLLLGIFVGSIIMITELAMGRKTGLNAIGAYAALSKKFKWVGFLAVLSPFLIMTFYAVLGGYCLQYIALNMAELGFDLQSAYSIKLSGAESFSAMLTNPLGGVFFTLLFLAVCYFILRGSVSDGIEKFNKIGMPALYIMLIVIIIRSCTMDGAIEGLKFMFVPGYAVSAGFIEKSPSIISVLATAGGQMFFSLSLAMGAMITYGSYLDKNKNLKKNSVFIVVADTVAALFAGLAVLPAAVANGIANGIPYNELSLGGPKLLFITLQDVFVQMGSLGPIFGIIFYVLVLIAAISSAISLMEVVAAWIMDKRVEKGKEPKRNSVALGVTLAITVFALLVAVDGLGSNGVWIPFQGTAIAGPWNSTWLDFMDCFSEGIAMPLGAILMSIMISWEVGTDVIIEEANIGSKDAPWFNMAYKLLLRWLVPVIMALVLAGSINEYFALTVGGYVAAGVVLVLAFAVGVINRKKA